MKTIKYSRFLDYMIIRVGEPLSGIKSLCKNVRNTWNWWCLTQNWTVWMTFGDVFSETNLDSSIIDVILLTNLIFLASNLGVPTLNITWSFLHARDIKEMAKIVTKQQSDLNNWQKKHFAEIINNLIIESYTLKFGIVFPTWSNSTLNVMNIFIWKSTINFWTCTFLNMEVGHFKHGRSSWAHVSRIHVNYQGLALLKACSHKWKGIKSAISLNRAFGWPQTNREILTACTWFPRFNVRRTWHQHLE